MAIAFWILLLASFAAGFDISTGKKCRWCASACCPFVYAWYAIGLLAGVVTLFTPWNVVYKSLMGPIFSNSKAWEFLDTFGRIVAVTLFLEYKPAQVFIATVESKKESVERACRDISKDLKVITVKDANKRKVLLKLCSGAYLNETWLFGTCGPLLVSDDKFVTRWCWSQGWKTVFYNHEEALLRTSISVTRWSQLSPKMHRWARTSWRSKPTEMFVERHVWKQQPWSVYATYFATTINIALIYDSLLWWTLSRSGWATRSVYAYFGLLLLVSKLIKALPHLLRCKRDILYIPIGILFGYYHGIIRLWTLATVCGIAWGSRDQKAAGQPSPITKTQGAQDQAPVALCPRLDLAVAPRENLSEIGSVMSTISPPQLSDVLAK
ncbi:hypothetical protein V499_00074 [Pseudogymnoascus sp. VKM F-103]|nr:hypothetical protein V499_00074 [Pseudogymnoascus sp. VKM F-103]